MGAGIADAANVFTDTEDVSLLQRRLAVVYGLLAVCVGGFYVLAAVLLAAFIPARFWAMHLSLSKLTHLGGVFVLLAISLACRGKLRPTWVLAAIDVVGLLATMAMAAVMVAFAPAGLPAQLMSSLAFVFFVCVRAALVPSAPRTTLIVSAVAALPIPWSAYAYAARDVASAAVVPSMAVGVMSAAWCVAGTVAAWAISRIVYGLRVEMKNITRLGQYTLEDKIGEGGMGSVYRARHALLRRPTAIKLLSPDHAGASNVKRFEREVQLTSKLTHPNTIAIYDFGHTRRGIFYYAMELIDGVSLQDLCEEDGQQPAGRVLYILAQIASALAEAHEMGLIHRDVKPANILLSSRGGLPDFVTVLDFGLVKEVRSSDPALSTANAIAGTPLYMAPESITRPDSVDARVDLYALGGVAYWLLTGSAPFDGANLVEICSRHLHTAPDPPSTRTRKTMPAALDALVLRCLAKTPEERPASARVLAAELRALQAECPWSEEDARSWWSARSAVRTSVAEN